MANVVLSFEYDVVRLCLTTHCIVAEIASYLDGGDLVQLSRASKWLYFNMWGSPSVWKRALSNVGVDVNLTVTPFRVLYALSILSFTSECLRTEVLEKEKRPRDSVTSVQPTSPDEDQPPQFMQTFYHGGPHRYFKLILPHGVSRVRIPALLSHAKLATLYRARPSPLDDPDYMAGNRYLQQLMDNDYNGRQPRVPIHSLVGRDYVAFLPLSRGH
ncbi:hypothetical protein B0J17DRAFT_721944 [Rhizoctonia solani]|nr:hypothetical protein B0J17DRAFT_721944 [Rhizoctonia solani]